MSKRKFRTFDEFEVNYYKKHPKELKSYLEVALEEFQKDGNERAFLAAIAVVSKVRGGVTKLSKDTGLNRENLYRSFFKSDPRLSNFIKIINSLGISLRIA
ncbi:MAG: addiction module antidote protein [Elusimicrobiota bacterium]